MGKLIVVSKISKRHLDLLIAAGYRVWITNPYRKAV